MGNKNRSKKGTVPAIARAAEPEVLSESTKENTIVVESTTATTKRFASEFDFDATSEAKTKTKKSHLDLVSQSGFEGPFDFVKDVVAVTHSSPPPFVFEKHCLDPVPEEQILVQNSASSPTLSAESCESCESDAPIPVLASDSVDLDLDLELELEKPQESIKNDSVSKAAESEPQPAIIPIHLATLLRTHAKPIIHRILSEAASLSSAHPLIYNTSKFMVLGFWTPVILWLLFLVSPLLIALLVLFGFGRIKKMAMDLVAEIRTCLEI
ncbi:hypothetical protein HDU99_002092 [Rhizoclosmatium hyalinum]|nr:hypothetical protein HDU99_002092 [Rhizoclosmatium hyalinum]